MLRERVKEIVDFATSESPYRSANKGWLSNDVYLQWGGDIKQKQPSKELDQFVKASIYWKPILQIASFAFLVICIGTTLAFAPVYLSSNRISSLGLLSQPSTPLEQIRDSDEIKLERVDVAVESIPPEQIRDSDEIKLERVDVAVESTSLQQTRDAGAPSNERLLVVRKQPNNSPSLKKTVTATDLFQSRQ